MKLLDYKKKLRTTKELLKSSWAYSFYYNMPIQNNWVFVDSRDGKDLAGNLLRIMEELSCGDYGKLRFIVWIRDKSKWRTYQNLCKKYSINNVRFCSRELIAVALMECSKYILLDSGMPWRYVKREGQILLNTWHGTPLKYMGRSVYVEKKKIANVQRDFLSCDYLLYPNSYMRDTMLRDYMVENVYQGTVLMNGYPRNSVFYDVERRKQLCKELGYEGKTIYAYMPTHRGTVFKMKNSEQKLAVTDYLTEIDRALNDTELLLVKLHIFNQSQIDFSQFRHVVPFPSDYETYDVLNTVDCLITDYSSVFFDYANTRKKIILFAYDKEEYFKDRGTYFPLEDLPFPIVESIEELIAELHEPKKYDDRAFLDKYCPYDGLEATKRLCKHIFLNNKECIEHQVGNRKENVLLFSGNLSQNGITSAYLSLLNQLDFSQRNYYACFRRTDVEKYPERIDKLPENMDFLPIVSAPYFTLTERMAYKKYNKLKKEVDATFPKLMERAFQREAKRCFGNGRFEHVIQFDGYGIDVNLLFAALDGNKAIVVHNDMIREVNIKGNQHRPLLKKIYSSFDHVAVVSEDIMQQTINISGRNDNVLVMHNQHPYRMVQEKAKHPIEFQKTTEIQCNNPAGVEGVLSSPGYKFISIGRFSIEKGHQRLLEAFDEFCDQYPDAQLIVIGGHGVLHKKTIEWMQKMVHWRNVTIIKSMNNPMPILKRCDLFVLSSSHEGLPVVLCEADCLGIPVAATDIPGPHSFIKNNNGYLMEESKEGILRGMLDYAEGKVLPMKVDFDTWNRDAMVAFESFFEERN